MKHHDSNLKNPDRSGRVIYLNGTSSAGKTTLAQALLEVLEEPYLYFSINLFDEIPSRKQIKRGLVPDIRHLELGFARCIAALAGSGNNVIVDDVIAPPRHLPAGQEFDVHDLLRQRVMMLNSFDVLFVKVFCPLDELERREIARGDRTIGLARSQYDLVHRYAVYDVEVDTSAETPEDASARVLKALANHHHPRALVQMVEMSDRPYDVRQASEADFDEMATVHVESIRSLCSPFYTKAIIEEWIASVSREKYLSAVAQGATFYVAEDEAGLLGFSEVHLAKGKEYNAAVFVSGRASRKGVGSALYRTAECQALREGAERIALNSSLAAVKFYEKNGFRLVHEGCSEMPSGSKMKIISMIKHFPVHDS
ncbi:MAG: GNAT family N-acetyltransferase [Gemmatimonadetes bacterium]|nr:GNAT family N-acetyltransferase [Gemmatimonadota bacterium]